jgi:hypothetical protein
VELFAIQEFNKRVKRRVEIELVELGKLVRCKRPALVFDNKSAGVVVPEYRHINISVFELQRDNIQVS